MIKSLVLIVILVFTNGNDHFVLRNSSVQLTISGGRITSILDVELEYVLPEPISDFLHLTLPQSRTTRGRQDGRSGHL